MCLSLAPAKFTGTDVLVHLCKHPTTGRDVHVLGYQNKPQNLAPRQRGNAMLLHIPSASPMGPENLVDTSQIRGLMDDLSHAAFAPHAAGGPARSFGFRASKNALPKVFDHDIYTIVMAESAEQIPAALAQVPEERRPELSAEIATFYDESFPGWTFILCCFDNREAKKAAPLLVWYEPMFPNLLVAPGIDSHNGRAPDVNAHVSLDHRVFFGHPALGRGMSRVRYAERHNQTSFTELPPDVRGFLPTSIAGADYRGQRVGNGDFVLDLSEPKARIGNVGRWKPQDFRRLAAA